MNIFDETLVIVVESANVGGVYSVNGKAGYVTLDKSDIGLSKREHSSPWVPLLLAPQSWQVGGCQGVPAFWRAYQARWRAAAVGSGIAVSDVLQAGRDVSNLGGLFGV